MSPSPTIIHQIVASNILFETRNLGECENGVLISKEDWKIHENTVLKPDIVLICNEPNDSYITKSPELIVAVVPRPLSGTKNLNLKFIILII